MSGIATPEWVGSPVGTAHALRSQRVPIGSVPIGGSCSVGQFRAAGIFSNACRQSQGRFGSSLRVFSKKARAHYGSIRASMSGSVCRPL